ncbi:MAG: hypothetical protein FJZ01_13260 [Candidatus Sericytochromatia bacterium]|nr:hypothetical protein [Candidatus Tanganyikabacteria bacterium]
MPLPGPIASLLTAVVLLAAPSVSFEAPETWFITQNQHPLYHPEPAQPYNSNCGPAALAMALKAYGLAPQGLGPRDLVRHVRRAMTGSDVDGSWTYPRQVRAAAEKFGLAAAPVYGLEALRRAVRDRRHLVIANVNPGGVYDHLLSIPYQGGHFTVVVAEGGSGLVLNDPLADRPALTVPVQTFQKALLADLGPGIPAYEGGVELWRPAARAASGQQSVFGLETHSR